MIIHMGQSTASFILQIFHTVQWSANFAVYALFDNSEWWQHNQPYSEQLLVCLLIASLNILGGGPCLWGK